MDAHTDERVKVTAAFWDKAVAGGSALQKALRGHLREKFVGALRMAVVNGLVAINCLYKHLGLGQMVSYVVE